MSKAPALALLAGGGGLPALLAKEAVAKGFRVFVVCFEGQPQPEGLPEVEERAEFPLGAVGAVLKQLERWGVSSVALAGNLSKPSFFSLKPDAKGLQLLMKARHYHDDQLLRAVADFLENEGLTVLSVGDLAPKLLADEGFMGEERWTPEEAEDVALGMDVLAAMGPLDIGQAVVVYKRVVLGVEAVEGTDALLARCAALRGDVGPGERAGILVKMAKPGQTDMADLPTVGTETLKELGRFSYRGVAVQAGRTVLLGATEFPPLLSRFGLTFESRKTV